MRLRPAALAFGLLGVPGVLVGQLPGPGGVAAFRDSLAVIEEPESLRAVLSEQEDDSTDWGQVRGAMLLRRVGVLEGDRAPIDQSLRTLARVAEKRQGWVVPWFEVGLTKLALHDEGYPVKEGPWQRLGSDYLHGAADAFVHALDAVPDDEASAVLLATTVLRETVDQDPTDALAALRRATRVNSEEPLLHLARARIEALVENRAEAIGEVHHYLRTGGDTGIANIELTRLLALTDSTEKAVAAYFAGAAFAFRPEVRNEYRADVAWILSLEELAEFDKLPADSVRSWLQRFWGRRSAREGRAQGERLIEHYRRLDYVLRRFRTTLEPRQLGSSATGNNPGAALRAISIPPADLRGLRRTAGGVAGSDDVLGAMRGETLLNSYRATQAVIDDRGVIYLRLGPPDQRATFNDEQADANESWKYLTPSGPLIFHFIGSAAPTRLVEQLPLDHELLGSRGQLDSRYNRLALDVRAGGRSIMPELLEDDRLRNAEAIRIGTTTDAFPLRFARPLVAVVQAYGLGTLGGGSGRAVVVFAARAGSLRLTRVTSDSLAAYPIRLRIIAERLEDGNVTEHDTLRTFVTRRQLRASEYLTGQATLKLPPGVYNFHVVVADLDREAGVALMHDGVTVPDLDAGRLVASDLILGRENATQRVVVAGEQVNLNPLNVWQSGEDVALYYQLGGLVPGEPIETVVALRRRFTTRSDAEVSVRFSEPASRNVMTFSRSLSLDGVPPGDYEIVLTLRAGDAEPVVRRQRLLISAR